VRGWHRLGLLGQGDFYSEDYELQRQELQLPAGGRWAEIAAVLPPGGVSLHPQLTLHVSGSNHSGAQRRSFAIHLRSERSRPVRDRRQGLTGFIDGPTSCPVSYGAGARRSCDARRRDGRGGEPSRRDGAATASAGIDVRPWSRADPRGRRAPARPSLVAPDGGGSVLGPPLASVTPRMNGSEIRTPSALTAAGGGGTMVQGPRA